MLGSFGASLARQARDYLRLSQSILQDTNFPGPTLRTAAESASGGFPVVASPRPGRRPRARRNSREQLRAAVDPPRRAADRGVGDGEARARTPRPRDSIAAAAAQGCGAVRRESAGGPAGPAPRRRGNAGTGPDRFPAVWCGRVSAAALRWRLVSTVRVHSPSRRLIF